MLTGLSERARSQVQEVFAVAIPPAAAGMRALDEIVARMWREGWQPAEPSVSTFTRDFGLLAAAALLALPNSAPAFRSDHVLDHFSVYFSASLTEYFPFHKAHKALYASSGESFFQLFAAAAAQAAGA